MESTYNLQRFLDAQEGIYPTALEEIENGRKRSHWIWFIFPQLKGLGFSYHSTYYGIESLEEATAYYSHPVLRQRLLDIAAALLKHKEKTAVEILSPIDARKVRSSATLFWEATREPVFKEIIDTFYEGKMDGATLRLLAARQKADAREKE